MDPSFLFASMQLAQQNQQLRALAQQQHDEETHQARLREHRIKLLASVKEDSEKLIHEVTDFPQQAFVKAQLMLHSLDYYDIVPDSFDDQTEKENIVLIWRKLINIANKSRSQITEGQLKQCTDCLTALSTENFIRTIADRIKAYEEFQKIKTKWEHSGERNRNIIAHQKTSWKMIATFGIVTFLLYAYKAGFEMAASILILWLLAGCALSFVIYLILESRRPKDFATIDQLYKNLRLASSADDEAFWDAVKEKFGGIPTTEQLKENWAQQEEVIKVVFREPAA